MTQFFDSIGARVGDFLPSLVGAIAILILGWLVATIVAATVKGVLKRTNLDNQLGRWITGRSEEDSRLPIEKWLATAVYWIIMTFVLVAFLNALQLQVVSEPLNDFLQAIFSYLPRLGGAALLLGLAWVIATISKLLLTRGLQRFNLDDRLAGTTEGTTGEGTEASPFLVNETLANALYWFIFLFFLPFVLDTLELQGPLAPVQNLLDDILSALPRILTALIIGVVGWLIARVVRGIVTNLLAAMGTDQLGAKFGLSQVQGGASLSSVIGTIVYVLILIPTAIAALNALEISAISVPAVAMLQQILLAIPQIFTAALVLVVFYVIGRFIAELVTNILTGIGFNNVFTWLGFPGVTVKSAPPAEQPIDAPAGEPVDTEPKGRTPSEVIGVITWVAIVLFGAVAATEVLQFPVLAQMVQATLRVSARVLSGVVVFAVGLYLANLAFNVINSSGGRQARILAQTARISIIALISAMALQQMGVATDIVNLAFGLLLGAIAVAIALAFGLGGRDVAAEQLREWLASFKQNQ